MNRLSYTIHSYSGHTANYTPDKILIDNPIEQSSRWTGSTGVGTSISSEESIRTSKSRTSSPAEFGNGISIDSGAGSSSSNVTNMNTKKKEVQYITLELEKPSLVKFVGFGKYHKVHPCNLSQLSIYGGLSPDAKHMELLYHGGLRNDSIQERIELGIYETRIKGGTEEGGGDILLPVKYIRIDALAAHSQNYNVSIWHVFLEGENSPELMKTVLADYEANRTLKSSHLILAHLRRTCLLTPFHSLLSSLPVNISKSFENPLITSLHTSLVLLGTFQAPLSLSSSSSSPLASSSTPDAETILEQCLSVNLFRDFESGGAGRGGKGKSTARWECLHPGSSLEDSLSSPSLAATKAAPSPRGGHQMVLVDNKIILFGGWNGEKDLGDLWEWDLNNQDDDEEDDDEGELPEERKKGEWKLLDDGIELEEEGSSRKPRGRSCHQFVLDELEGWIYLLGGMGPAPSSPSPSTSSVVATATAIPISTEPPTASTITTNGEREEDEAMEVEVEIPPPSSNSKSSRSSSRKKELNPWKNDFWRYKATGINKGIWELLSEDVSLEGGPKLLFDHQMVVHSEGRKIYVFGGKHENEPNSTNGSTGSGGNESVYSGLFSYDIVTRKWHNFFGDATKRDNLSEERAMLMSRMGSAMLLDSSMPALYIFSGQRASANLRDLWMLRIVSPPSAPTEAGIIEYINEDSTNSLHVKLLSEDYTKVENSSSASPPVGFAQRASLDVESGDWTLLSGLLQDKKTGADLLSEEIWRRNKFGNWENVQVKGISPRGRYAGPVLYDPITKYHYMMGGNPQDTDRSKRLGDLWRLKINKPSPREALRQAKFLIRKQKFNEMCQTQSTVSALTYLQTQLSAVVDHSDEDEASAFRACMTYMISAPVSNNHDDDEIMGDSTSSSTNLGSSTSSLIAGEDLSLSQFTSPTAPILVSGSTSSNVDSHLNQAQIIASAISNSSSLPEISLYTQRQELFEKLLGFFPESECQPKEDLRNLCRRTK